MVLVRRRRLAVGVACAVAGLAAMGLFSGPAGAGTMVTRSMYDKRYCEYLFIYAGPSGFYADVWNTFGLNDCPNRLWNATASAGRQAALAKKRGALVVKRNGPRHWLIDRAQIKFDPNAELKQGVERSFYGLRMRRLTTGLVPTVNGQPGLPSYTETTVNRTTHFTFSRRHPLRVLVSRDGKSYAMQAYSQIKDPTLTERRLNSLDQRLALPDGWRFEVRRLAQDLTLSTVGQTTVLQDELENTYQLID